MDILQVSVNAFCDVHHQLADALTSTQIGHERNADLLFRQNKQNR